MAIPEKPLKLTFDPDELTLDEQALFFERESPFRPSVFKAFLKKYGNWTPRQLDGLVRKDVAAVYESCVEQLIAVMLPKGKADT